MRRWSIATQQLLSATWVLQGPAAFGAPSQPHDPALEATKDNRRLSDAGAPSKRRGSTQQIWSILVDPNRESVLLQAQKLLKARYRVLDSYRRVKVAFKGLADRYLSSKATYNLIERYTLMDRMVKDVANLERKYEWTLLLLPAQSPAERDEAYVARIVRGLDGRLDDRPEDKGMPQPGGIAVLIGQAAKVSERAKENGRVDMLAARPTNELKQEIAASTADLHRVLKKYLRIREVLHELVLAYERTRPYPIVPRYTLLKRMIKATLRSETFTEICHEREE